MNQTYYFKGKDGRDYPDSDSLSEAEKIYENQYLRFKGKNGRDYPDSDSLSEANFNHALSKCREATNPILYGFYLGDIFSYLRSQQGQERCIRAMVNNIVTRKDDFGSFTHTIEEIAGYVVQYLQTIRNGELFDVDFLIRLETNISNVKVFGNKFKTARNILQEILGRYRKSYEEEEQKRNKQGENRSRQSENKGQKGQEQRRYRKSYEEEEQKRNKQGENRSRQSENKGQKGQEQRRYKEDEQHCGNTQTKKTAYDLLGIQNGASKLEIKKAYRAYMRELHPDRALDDEEARVFTEHLKIVNSFYDENK